MSSLRRRKLTISIQIEENSKADNIRFADIRNEFGRQESQNKSLQPQPIYNRPREQSRSKNSLCPMRVGQQRFLRPISRAIVGWAGICRWNIILTVFIFMFDGEIWIFDNVYGLEGPRCVGYGHGAARSLQVFRQTPLIPDI
jgi:hypothetical protein